MISLQCLNINYVMIIQVVFCGNSAFYRMNCRICSFIYNEVKCINDTSCPLKCEGTKYYLVSLRTRAPAWTDLGSTSVSVWETGRGGTVRGAPPCCSRRSPACTTTAGTASARCQRAALSTLANASQDTQVSRP